MLEAAFQQAPSNPIGNDPRSPWSELLCLGRMVIEAKRGAILLQINLAHCLVSSVECHEQMIQECALSLKDIARATLSYEMAVAV